MSEGHGPGLSDLRPMRVPNHGHYENALAFIDSKAAAELESESDSDSDLALAQVHATLAVVEAIDRLTAAITDTADLLGTVD